MRKLKRSIARSILLRAGFTRLNKKGADGKSAFARHWRQYV